MKRGTADALGQCVYIGDGSGDVHATLQLGEGDVVLARSGKHFSLLPALTRHFSEASGTSKPCIVPWDSGLTVLDTITRFVCVSEAKPGPGGAVGTISEGYCAAASANE
jgi:Putative Phosphatase